MVGWCIPFLLHTFIHYIKESLGVALTICAVIAITVSEIFQTCKSCKFSTPEHSNSSFYNFYMSTFKGAASIKIFKQSLTIPNVVNITKMENRKVQHGSTICHFGLYKMIQAAIMTPIL